MDFDGFSGARSLDPLLGVVVRAVQTIASTHGWDPRHPGFRFAMGLTMGVSGFQLGLIYGRSNVPSVCAERRLTDTHSAGS